MKKLLTGIVISAMLCGAPAVMGYPGQISVLVNGQPVPFDQPPVMAGGRVLVPLRGVFQQLGATVVYNPSDRSINAQQGARSISLAVGSHTAMISGQPSNLDTPPILVGGRALVPLRFLAQALNATVDWHPERYLVTVTSAAPVEAGPPEHYEAPRRAVIRDVQIEEHAQLLPGQSVNVRMWGSPRGQATLDVGRIHGLPMLEEHEGEYRATYTVRGGDHERSAVVIGHLQLRDGSQADKEAPERLTLGALGPPTGGYEGSHHNEYLITSVTHNGTSPLLPGQLLEVTMTGAPGGQATFAVGYNRDIPMREVAPGTYIGQYTIPAGPRQSGVEVVAHLQLRSGDSDSKRGPNLRLVGGP